MAITAKNISIDEIASVLGCNYDLASIRDCDNINPWAKYKPINYNLEAISNPWDKTGDLTDSEREAVHWGTIPPGANTDSIAKVPIAGSFTWTGSHPVWNVFKPSSQVRAVMRLRDFIGYEHSGGPDFSISLDQEVYAGSVFKTGLTNITADSRYYVNLYDLEWENKTVDNWYVWYIFYQKDGNGKYEPKYASYTGVTVGSCTPNNHHPEVNPGSNFTVGQTYTMLACASPSGSGYSTTSMYRISQVSSIYIVPLTLTSSNALTTFEVVSSPKTPEEEAREWIIINNTNGYQGVKPMSFTKSGQNVTWDNMEVGFTYNGTDNKVYFRLTLMDNDTAISDPLTIRFESLTTASYLSRSNAEDSLTFTNFTQSSTSSITGVKIEVQYTDGNYYYITTVQDK